MLQNFRVAAFTVSELLNENQLHPTPPHPHSPQIRVKAYIYFWNINLFNLQTFGNYFISLQVLPALYLKSPPGILQ